MFNVECLMFPRGTNCQLLLPTATLSAVGIAKADVPPRAADFTRAG